MRCFVGIPIPDGPRAAAAGVQRDLQAATRLRARWADPEGFHMTLAFLGSVDPSLLPPLRDAVSRALAPVPPFPVRLGGAGAFPTPRRPRVVWLGVVNGADRLVAVAEALRSALASLAVPVEDRPYQPHLTVARIRTPQADRGLAAALYRVPGDIGPAWVVKDVTLYESVLDRRGARHRPEAVLPLGAAS